MLNTYLNDNQRRPYPFYGGCALPFPMSCITGLGVCLQEDELLSSPVYANVIVVSKDSVRVALCRDPGEEVADAEFIGIIYANTQGFYTYVASSSNSAVYETNKITDPVDLDRLVFFDDPDTGTALRVFYSYVSDITKGIPRSTVKSTGYMKVGTIPEAAIGVYTGKFYLDPTCVASMPQEVLGYHTKIVANGMPPVETGRSVVLSAGGLLTLSVTAGTVSFGALESADSLQLTKYPARSFSFVTSINGVPVPVGGKLVLHCDDDRIVINSQKLESGTVVIELDGTTEYPNCYDSRLDHAVPQ